MTARATPSDPTADVADTPDTFTVWFSVTCPTAVLAETVIPELIDVEPTLDDILRPLNATVTDPDTPCEAKAASAKLEAAKVTLRVSQS